MLRALLALLCISIAAYADERECAAACYREHLACVKACGGEEGDGVHAECRAGCGRALASCACDCGDVRACRAGRPEGCQLPVALNGAGVQVAALTPTRASADGARPRP